MRFKLIFFTLPLFFLFACASTTNILEPRFGMAAVKTSSSFKTESFNLVNIEEEYITNPQQEGTLASREMNENLTISFVSSESFSSQCDFINASEVMEKVLDYNPEIGRYLINRIKVDIILMADSNFDIKENVSAGPDSYSAVFYIPVDSCEDNQIFGTSVHRLLYQILHEVYHVDDLIDISVGETVDIVDFEYTAMKRTYCDLILQPYFAFVDIENAKKSLNRELASDYEIGYKKFFDEISAVAGETRITKEISTFPDLIDWCEEI